MGAVDQTQLAFLYRSADLLLLTSRFEGMPRAPLEAVGCGLPVITTRAGEVARFVIPGHTGEIVDERTPEAFASVVLRALAERDRYTVTACMRAVDPYRPASVLSAVYERARSIASRQQYL
jgi:glycosyltransferase involved in cell wall biosynthesis